MAKLVAPLFSFGASGALAKALVYFPWKGVNAVRSYVVPANPKTAAQLTQRTRMTNAVAEWHAALYTADDVSAWNRLANLLTNSLSGFNRMVKEWIEEDILGNTWEQTRDAVTSLVVATGFTVNIGKASLGNIPTVRYGVSPTALLTSAALVDQTGGRWEVAITGLNASTLYFYTFDVGASAVDFGRLGIYTQRTAA